MPKHRGWLMYLHKSFHCSMNLTLIFQRKCKLWKRILPIFEHIHKVYTDEAWGYSSLCFVQSVSKTSVLLPQLLFGYPLIK